jgi:hypothetical protein
MKRVLTFVIVLLLLSIVSAQGDSSLSQITGAITEAAAEAESGVLPGMVAFFGFVVTIGFAWAIVKAIRS